MKEVDQNARVGKDNQARCGIHDPSAPETEASRSRLDSTPESSIRSLYRIRRQIHQAGNFNKLGRLIRSRRYASAPVPESGAGIPGDASIPRAPADLAGTNLPGPPRLHDQLSRSNSASVTNGGFMFRTR